MLRITQQTSSAAAKSYYTTADYYLGEGQELPGVWRGIGAAHLGLTGEVKQADWNALCENLDPRSGASLTARTNATRRVGWDFTFSVPKSVSLLYSLSKDERILDAFTDAVDRTMADIESELATRVRTKGQNVDRISGNGIWGRFIHVTSRPVDGVPDPQLHAHCFMMNATLDSAEDRWKAAQIGSIKRDANYFNGVMHGRLAAKLVELGVPIERTAKSWRVAGLSEATEAKFSRRTSQIDAEAHRLGITDPDDKAQLGAHTRSRKNAGLNFDALRDFWSSRLTTEEADTIARIHAGIGERTTREADPSVARASLGYAADHHLERESVVPERTLLTTALHHAIGRATPEDVLSASPPVDLIVAKHEGRTMVTSSAVLAEETRMIRFARDGRNTCAPLASGEAALASDWLSAEQRQALSHLATSRDRVMVLRGKAGTGKSTLLKFAVEHIERGGHQVFVFAPSVGASHDVLRKEGFEDANTVAWLLANPEAQAAVANQVILIDEAGLVGVRTMAKVFDLAERSGARVILSGDRGQHKSVEAGSALHLLEREAGIRSAQLSGILRQRDRYRQAVADLSDGRIDAGLKTLDALGWIHEISNDEERYGRIAEEYLKTTNAGESVIVVSPTHAEGARVTQSIRAALKREGKIGVAERDVLKLTSRRFTAAQRREADNYSAGDLVVFTQNAKDHRKGSRLTVGVDAIPFDQADRFDVFRTETLGIASGDLVRVTANATTADGHRVNNGQVYGVKSVAADGTITLDNCWRLGPRFGYLDFGFVSTSHASQGKTRDRVIIAAAAESFPAANREQLYVSASRGRHSLSLYTDDQAGLREAVSIPTDMTSATELMARDRHRQRMAALAAESIDVAIHNPRREMVIDER